MATVLHTTSSIRLARLGPRKTGTPSGVRGQEERSKTKRSTAADNCFTQLASYAVANGQSASFANEIKKATVFSGAPRKAAPADNRRTW